ncbi:MAG: YkgJ family cysteine cluster protein [Bacillota bacterium]
MKKLTGRDLDRAIKTAENNGFFQNLYRIYDTIPKGQCYGCTRCCMESVNTYYIEFLNIYRYLQENQRLRQELEPKILKYFLTEMVSKEHCPFLNEEGMCSIYAYRPLSCRLFGHWTQEEYEENYKNVLSNNIQVMKFFKNKYGLAIPEEIVTYKIDYCKDFEIQKRIRKDQRQKMVDSIFTMESAFFMRGLITEDYIGTGLVPWFVYTIFEKEKAGDLRIQVMKEMFENGCSETLEEAVSKIKL